jgi:saccharopepsin
MMTQDLLDEPIFTMRFGNSSDDGGEVLFGGIDGDHYTGDISYVPIRSNGPWQIDLEDVIIRDERIKLQEMTTAGINTGTLYIQASSDIVETINSKIGAKRTWYNHWTIDCTKISDLPDIYFYIGGKPYGLSSADYILDFQGTCVSAFVAGPPETSYWTLGEPHTNIYSR